MTIQQDAGPATPDYRRVFGWPVGWHNGGLALVTGSGIGVIAIPRSMADRVLPNLARQGCDGPALAVPTKHGAVVMLLVEADVLAPDSLPAGVRVLTAGTMIPLPSDRNPNQLTHWIVPPDTRHRWLPSLNGVLACIRAGH